MAKSKFTLEQQAEIARIQEQEGITRKSAIRKFIYRKIKNPFPLAFWSIDLRGVGDLPCSGGWEAENRTSVEDNDDVY
jgi:hypothetical protein